jgi:hypothetical protein
MSSYCVSYLKIVEVLKLTTAALKNRLRNWTLMQQAKTCAHRQHQEDLSGVKPREPCIRNIQVLNQIDNLSDIL